MGCHYPPRVLNILNKFLFDKKLVLYDDARGKFVSGAKVLAAVPSISQPRRVYEDRLETGGAVNKQ